jgi:hypothetical protein
MGEEKTLKIEPKVTFYVLPENLRNDTNRSCNRPEMKQYQVTEEELYEKLGGTRDECIQGPPKQTSCLCGPAGHQVTKYGSCWDYYTAHNVYCYTRCESCYVICNR